MRRYLWQIVFAAMLAVATCLAFLSGRHLPPNAIGQGHSSSDNKSQQNPSVLGNSMAPTLFGTHHRATCPQCGHLNRFTSESFPATVYYCGQCREEIRNPSFVAERGDSVQVEPITDVRRWDIVLLRDPGESMRIIKRMVAFPGEQLQIKQGDLWIDGKRIERTLNQVLETQIPLHVDRAISETDPPKNELAAASEPAGTQNLNLANDMQFAVGWRATSPAPISSQAKLPPLTQRIEFVYGEPWKSSPDLQTHNRLSGSIVSDWYPENPAFTGPLWPVSDQILEICFEPQSEGELKVGLRDVHSAKPQCLWLEEWNSVWSKESWSSGATDVAMPRANGSKACLQYTLAYVDGAYWMRARRGQLARQHAAFHSEQTLLEWKKIPVELTMPIGQNCAAEVLWTLQFKGVARWHYRRVARDIYYRSDPWSESRGLPTIRALQGYFLLGDNQPISLDSRQKPGWLTGVPRAWLEGRISAPK